MSKGLYYSVRFRFMIIAVFALLIIGGLFFCNALRGRSLAIAAAGKNAASYSAALSEHAERVFTEVDSSLKDIVEEIRLYGGMGFVGTESFQKMISKRVKNELKFSSIYVLDQKGNLIAHSHEFPVKKRNLANRPYFRYHRDRADSDLFISPPYESSITKSSHFSVSRSLRDAEGKFNGLVSLTIETSYFNEFYKGLDVGINGRIVLAKLGGEFLSIVPPPENAIRNYMGGKILFSSLLSKSRDEENQIISPVSGDKRVMAYHKLDSFPVVAMVSYSLIDLLSPWKANLIQQGFIELLLTLLGLTAVYFFLCQLKKVESANLQLQSQQEELINLENQLGQAQKMEAIGQLSGGIAHDFNNLLTPILIYSDMLKRSLPDNEKAKAQLDGIIKASTKARDLTQQLLSFGRRQVMQMQVVDLNEIVASFYPMIRRMVRENIDINLQLSNQPVVTRADNSKLKQVLLNLLLNAQDAIVQNGTILIETGVVLIDDEFARRYPGMEPGRFVLLSFSDNGRGMKPETVEHIFEPFFSTKEVGHGIGLGLANVYGIVKQHKGYITVESTSDVGTCFKIYIPFCDEKPQSTGDEAEDTNLEYTGTAVILLVEDNEMVRKMTLELLEGFGYTVYCAGDPARALELLGEIEEKIDLVITDVVMPGMNGQQLFKRINAEHPEIEKVLYMSGYTDSAIVTDSQLDEGVHLLTKPFTVDALMAKIKEMLLT